MSVMSNAPRKSEDGELVKCVVWDLDNTLWEGTLLEDERVRLREGVTGIIEKLDARGILQSIASRNDPAKALGKLEEFGLRDYFLYPQINWNSKAHSIQTIAKLINIGLDSIAFVDDQPFELAEVNFSVPSVRCIDVAELPELLDRPEMTPRFITADSRLRRLMYLNDIRRNTAEEEFVGPKEEFLATLGMTFTIATAREEDLKRAEELTVRTNQLNSTGHTYSYDELDQFRRSENHLLLIAELEDKFGSYGKIGLALVDCQPEVWTIKLLLMSCRVMSRGVGAVLMSHIMRLAKQHGVRLRGEFVPTERNRMMLIAYKFSGFKEVERHPDDGIVMEHDLAQLPSVPEYIDCRILD
jgi:FkbH-like protein